MHAHIGHESSNAAKLALDRAWQISQEVTVAGQRVMLSSPALLFALCDATRARDFPGSSATRFLGWAMRDSWDRLAVERASFLARSAHQEARSEYAPHLSRAASYVMRISGLLARDRGPGAGARLRDLLLALLLHPEAAGAIAAHDVLRSTGHEPWRLAMQLAESIAAEANARTAPRFDPMQSGAAAEESAETPKTAYR